MLILHTAESYPPLVSGIPEVVSQLSKRLARRGHEVHVATGAVPGLPAVEVMDGVTVHRFDVQGNDVKGNRGDSRGYLEFVQSRQWHVTASHCAQTWTTDLLLGEGSISGATVFVAHGLSAYDNAAYKAYFDKLSDWIRNDKAMVSLSTMGIDDARFIRDHNLPAATIIPNGIDLAEWSTPTLGVRRAWKMQDKGWLLNVSTHSPAKGHDRLFEVMNRLQGSDFPSMRLTQIGRGNPAFRWNLGRVGIRGGCFYRCMTKRMFSKSIKMLLNVSRDETISAMKEADLMILSSKWEASPLVVLECMAAGTPFVTFDVGCVREHVGGRVVESVNEMSEAVIELMSNPTLRAELGAQGQKRVAEKHDWEVIVDQYENLYRHLISNRRKAT